MDLQLTGARAFVSGSTRGIGFAIARGLLTEGAVVVVNGRSPAAVAQAVEALRVAVPGGEVSGIAADLGEAEGVRALTAELGDVDVLVNNVGVFEVKAFAEAGDDDWERFLSVNLMSAVRLSRRVLPAMLARGSGRIISISSESGVDVPADMLPYGVSKAGLIALGNGLAKLTKGTAVTVNTVLGGPTLSDGVADAIGGIAQAQGLTAEEMTAAVIAGRPTSLLQRFLDPREVADLAVWLASPLSSAVNGAALRAEGGVLTTVL